MTAPIDIRPHDLETVRAILRAVLTHEAKVWVFGSRATWTTKDSSDLDLAIDAGRPLTRDEESALRNAFEDSDLPYTVDVVDMQTVGETFRKIVERDRVEFSFVNIQDAMDHTTLAEFAEILGGFAFKSGDFSDFGIPVVKISAVEPPFIDITKCEHILPEKASGLERFKIINGDMVMAMTGATTGKVGRYWHSLFAFINQRVAKISAKAGKSTDDFIYAILTQPGFDQIVLSQAHGSAQPNISTTDIGRITVPNFDYKVQEAIGGFIRCIDDKIELNRRMNETLERMARAIFKDWFVDFGPIRAKAEGRAPYLAPELWSLFPNTLERDQPTDWKNSMLVDIAEVIMGAPPDGATYNSDGNGDLIVGVRGSTTGRHAYADRQYCLGRGVCAIRARNGHKGFVEYQIIDRMEELLTKTMGSVFPNLVADNIKSFPVLLPPEVVLQRFEAILEPLRARICANVRENANLAKTRDYLLPKLMSGEIRICEAEKLVTAAV